jgi:hypothetical protein
VDFGALMMTHTFATMEISDSAYNEIVKILRDVGYYDHVANYADGALDMHGIGLVRRTPEKGETKMENQHREIKGYRELNSEEIALMNEIKTKGAEIGEMVAKLRYNNALDQRWVSIGSTHMQEGLMALTRSIAQPTFF